MKKLIASLGILSLFIFQSLASSVPAHAEFPDLTEPAARFGRGLTNVIFSPSEILYQPMKMNNAGRGGHVSIYGGVPLGVLHFPIRLVQGLYEIVTFPIVKLNSESPFIDTKTIVERFQEL